MLHRVVRLIVLSLVRLFYPRVEVQGREHVPPAGPVIFVANHPNGLLDPLVVTSYAGRPVRFLTASYLFRYPVLRLCMNAFDALPVYREGDKSSGAVTDIVAANEETFARCRAWLREQGALALFPEGTTHGGPKLLRMRSGAARIGIGAEVESSWHLGVRVVPVGLWYQNKTMFRSRVLVVFGEPFGLTDYSAAYAQKPTTTLRAVTKEIAQRLSAVVLQAENRELLDAMPVIAAWTDADGPPSTLADRYEQAGVLLKAYTRLSQADPARLDTLTQQARRYARTLRLLGIDDPWALELPDPGRWRLVRRGALLLVGFPLAVAGFVCSYGPYRLARPVARRLAHDDDTQLGHYKLIAGSVLVFLGWLLTAGLVGWLWGVRRAAMLLVAQPLLGYSALRWGERWHELREALRYSWIRERHRSLTQHLVDRRRTLAGQVMAAMESVREVQPQREAPAGDWSGDPVALEEQTNAGITTPRC